MGGNYKLLLKFFTIQKIIREVDPDFVNSHYVTSHGFIAALIKNWTKIHFKLIQSTWGTDILVTPFKNRVYYLLTKYSLNKANLITSDSEYMTSVIKSISRTETLIFSFGLDALPDVSINEKDENLFYSNRMLTENYNIKEVIDLFNVVAQLNHKAHLIISHDGEQRKNLENYTKELGLEQKVTFIGFVSLEEQLKLYRQAQVYLSLPTSDSTSVSLIEAMAYGCIPILSNIPANHEWVKDGLNGIIYNKQDFNITKFSAILSNKVAVVRKNREIVKEKGIFPESIKHYTEKINQIQN